MKPIVGPAGWRASALRCAGALIALIVVSALLGSTAWADPPAPPGRVGRLSWQAGEVTLRASADAAPAAAQRNWPITSGNVLATGPAGRAEVWIGSSALRLDVDSELQFTQIDDQQLRLRLVRGSLALRSATLEATRSSSVETPQGRFTPVAPGEFRVDSGAPPPGDDFQAFVRNRDAAFDGRAATRYVSPEMTGIEDLDSAGHWQPTAEYGAVWLPTVAPGWAPYRDGRWAWLEPWGWTWIDAAPWGFAPFHYGRWVLWHERWAWVPGGYVAHPVYAPALAGWAPPAPQREGLPLGRHHLRR